MRWLRRLLGRGLTEESGRLREEADERARYVDEELLPRVEEQTRRLERIRQQNHFGAMIEAVIQGSKGR